MSHEKKSNKPAVLCIGPQKTATTWLFSNFKDHPQVWVPDVKELHYLSHGIHIPNYSILKVFFSPHWYYRGLRSLLQRKLWRCLSPSYFDKFNGDHTRWVFNYTLGKRSYDWYAGLFPVSPKIGIDISPSYYTLSEEKIQAHQAFNPSSKVIVTIRNPIDRLWSSARMILCRNRGRSIDQVSNKEYRKFFDREYKRWNPYLQTIAIWKRYFDNVYIAYYDELVENPKVYFSNICTFLDINTELEPKDINRRVLEGIHRELPLQLRIYLYKLFGEEMKDMANKGIVYAHKWLEEHDKIVENIVL